MKIQLLSLFALVAGALCASAETFSESVGLQLYSLRDQFKKDVPGTMEWVGKQGFKEVELATTYGLGAEEFLALLKKNGLTAIAGHYPYDRYKSEPEKVAAEAKALGLKYAGVAWIPHKDGFDEQDTRDAAEVFNKAGAALKKEGIQFYYHIHGYEFHKHGDGTLFDLLIELTDKDNVAYQLDTLWAVLPDQDPVALLKKYGSRWQLMHLKDLKKGIALGNHSGGTDVKNDVPLGTGQMDWPAILKAAKEAGVKYYFIEDESPSSVEQIPQSVEYLKTVKW
ncbi:sugar phosphate isomerase/epimerase [Luteolibacter sp. SL250]|uniref:sugar phosphate isomerase/epimerase family protein n=1 Tax=Luteolibacter sp. SL250 TaxID=2995170 RepID=UPI00226FB98A|nr:sugar phosphate isomerase/epimerase [Luteolibacter sp. SL250]WAC20787.1 sugar phosphate isomerase/epimerase [Luteolibacter sp. SL250]